MKKEVSYKIVSLVFAILVICFLAAFYVLGWTEPTAVPPGGNVPAPINVGGSDQWKDGRLGVGGGTPPEPRYWLTDVGNSLYFQNRLNETKMVIGENGNVGIGTPSPDKLVHLYNNAGGAGIGLKIQNVGDNGAAELYLQNDARAYIVGIRTDDKFTIHDLIANSPRLTIDTNGNLGIGAHAVGGTSPNHLLHLLKDAGGAGIGLKIENSGTDGAAELYLQNDARTYTVGIRTDDKFTIFDNAAGLPRLTIDTNGNVGIGTMSPGAKLEVAGQIKITGGSPGAGKVLTTDASGLASWQAAAGGGAITYQDCKQIDVYNRRCYDATPGGGIFNERALDPNGDGNCEECVPGCTLSGVRVIVNPPAPWMMTGGHWNSSEYTDGLFFCRVIIQ